MTKLTKTEIAVVHGGLGMLEAVVYLTVAASVPTTIRLLCSRWCADNHRLYNLLAFTGGAIGVFVVYFATSAE